MCRAPAACGSGQPGDHRVVRSDQLATSTERKRDYASEGVMNQCFWGGSRKDNSYEPSQQCVLRSTRTGRTRLSPFGSFTNHHGERATCTSPSPARTYVVNLRRPASAPCPAAFSHRASLKIAMFHCGTRQCDHRLALSKDNFARSASRDRLTDGLSVSRIAPKRRPPP